MAFRHVFFTQKNDGFVHLYLAFLQHGLKTVNLYMYVAQHKTDYIFICLHC